MFDGIGRTRDAEAGRRGLASLVLTSLALGGTGAFLAAWTAWTAVHGLHDDPGPAPDDGPMVEVVIPEPDALPGLPPPPPPAAAAPEPESDDSRVEPDEPVDVVTELMPVVPEPVRSASRHAGDASGTADGHPDGRPGGIAGGHPDGVPGGRSGAGGEVRAFHHTDLETRSRVDPVWPVAAAALGGGEHRCVVRVRIDPRGIPVSAEVSRCPEVFHASARDALLKWRWYPPRIGRERVSAETLIAVVFKDG